jgi:nicotinate phosphoribosyltransferase
MEEYPELLYKVGGSSGHSAVLHIGTDEDAFEMQLRAYYRIKEGDSAAVVREKIKNTKGIGPTFLIDTFDSTKGLDAAIRVMKKYGIQSQVRNDSGNPLERVKYIRTTLDGEELNNVKIMLSDDLKPWKIYELLKQCADFNTLLMGTYLVNPYKLPGAVYKIAADQKDINNQELVPSCKVCLNNPEKGTLPGRLDVYRIIGSDGMADRDVILLREVDAINDYMKPEDQRYIKLTQRIMENGKVVYKFPDMCELIETTKYHMGLIRPEHKRFRNAVEYPVIVSPTVQRLRENITRQYAA